MVVPIYYIQSAAPVRSHWMFPERQILCKPAAVVNCRRVEQCHSMTQRRHHLNMRFLSTGMLPQTHPDEVRLGPRGVDHADSRRNMAWMLKCISGPGQGAYQRKIGDANAIRGRDLAGTVDQTGSCRRPACRRAPQTSESAVERLLTLKSSVVLSTWAHPLVAPAVRRRYVGAACR